MMTSGDKRLLDGGVGRCSRTWRNSTLVALRLSSLHPSPASPPKATGEGGEADSSGSFLAPHAMVLSDSTTLGRHAMGTPTAQGPAVSGERNPVPPLPSGAQVGGLAPERDRLLALGLSVPVVRTIQEARAPSTRMAYSYWWEVGGVHLVWDPPSGSLLSHSPGHPAVLAGPAGRRQVCCYPSRYGGSY